VGVTCRRKPEGRRNRNSTINREKNDKKPTDHLLGKEMEFGSRKRLPERGAPGSQWLKRKSERSKKEGSGDDS